jgi:hypothetical protein
VVGRPDSIVDIFDTHTFQFLYSIGTFLWFLCYFIETKRQREIFKWIHFWMFLQFRTSCFPVRIFKTWLWAKTISQLSEIIRCMSTISLKQELDLRRNRKFSSFIMLCLWIDRF